MDILISLIVSGVVILLGALCLLFPRWVISMVCRHASSYMKEDLSADPTYIYMFRFYGAAAALLGLYALFQVVGNV
ncbi:MAG: hypothetical protein JSV26_04165 [bacterium]|nr:MAG: hypothetical protein JSV26_04165 [bacterium]